MHDEWTSAAAQAQSAWWCGDDGAGRADMPLFWTYKTLQLLAGALGLALNIMLAYIAYRCLALGKYLRRVLACTALTHALLAGYVLAKALHAFISIKFGSDLLASSVDGCKFQESLFMFAYLHCALCFCTLGVERARTFLRRRRDLRARAGTANCTAPPPTGAGEGTRIAGPPEHRLPPPAVLHADGSVDDRQLEADEACTFSLSMLILVSGGLALALLVTRAKDEIEPWPGASSAVTLPLCNVLLAMSTTLALCFCSTVLCTYLAAVLLFLAVAVVQKRRSADPARLLATMRLGRYLLLMLAAWGFVTVATGALLLGALLKFYGRRASWLYFALEATVYAGPASVALLHPFAAAWYIRPLRDAFTDMIPMLGNIIPPRVPPALAGEDSISFRTSRASSEYMDIKFDLPDEKLMALGRSRGVDERAADFRDADDALSGVSSDRSAGPDKEADGRDDNSTTTETPISGPTALVVSAPAHHHHPPPPAAYRPVRPVTVAKAVPV